ncbi:hypothetical protein G9A89_016521 [Geosiphon pyriformis]|nr:hypothetical protein G9A89_016521 [Geosiphon pyriformis]
MKKGRKKQKKKNQHSQTAIPLILTHHYNQPTIIDQSLYASIVARNCHQWAHAVAIMKNTPLPPDFTAAHDNQSCLVCGTILSDKEMWNDIPGQRGIKKHYNDWKDISTINMNFREWHIQKQKNNPEEFHEHYQQLALTREEQEEWLVQLNTRLCDHCLILCDFQYCNECDLIYNSPPYIIYTIPEEKEPISSCTLELKSVFDPNSNSDNDDNENTSSSSAQNNNENISNSDSDSNPKIYIALPNLSKEQELK